MNLISLIYSAGALAAVIGAILLVARLAKLTRFGAGGTRSTGRLGLVEQLSIDPKRRLVLVRCDGRCVLLLTGQQDQVVGWLPGQPT